MLAEYAIFGGEKKRIPYFASRPCETLSEASQLDDLGKRRPACILAAYCTFSTNSSSRVTLGFF
jgi:hypothetical protein